MFELDRFGDPVHFDMNERFAARLRVRSVTEPDQLAADISAHRHDRVDDQVQGQPVPIHLHRHRVDQKRHIVVDDLDDRMRRLPAVFLDTRVEDSNARRVGCAFAGEVAVGEGGTVQIRYRDLEQFDEILRRLDKRS